MYAKVFTSILSSSIWSEKPQTRIVWITMLTLADKNGFVRSVPDALARLANVTQDECDAALAIFSAEDPRDSSEQYQGRRILALPGGWFIYQHAKYHNLQSEEDRRETWRKASRKYRLKTAPNDRQQSSTPRHTKRHTKSTEAVAVAVAVTSTSKTLAASGERVSTHALKPPLQLNTRAALNAIANAVVTQRNPDGTTSTFIRPESITALGDDNIVTAYHAAGGAKDFTSSNIIEQRVAAAKFKSTLAQLRAKR